jgi:hypothetical protein
MPAFPGAEGFGSDTPGGRGGQIIEVTNLNASGAGSFRDACSQSDPRIIVFKTGGIIEVTRDINIVNPYITIAGQTAPGDGICIRGATIRISTHDVIMRGIRIRVGDSTNGPDFDNRDGIGIESTIAPPYNVIIDHCSISWAIDENCTIWYLSHDITFQWCIISEALANSLHPKGVHSMGLLVGPGAKRISIHHNLLAHNRDRNPLLGGGNSPHPEASGATEVELINNVIYNYYWQATQITKNLAGDVDTNTQYANIVGNYYKKGIDTASDKGIWALESQVNPETKIYVLDNIGPGRPTGDEDEWAIVEGSLNQCSLSPIFPMTGIYTESAFNAYNSVLAGAGALAPTRDPVDTRVVQSVIDKTGFLIDSQNDVGGWPNYNAGTPSLDTDHDGMPDEWEATQGLNPNDDSDGIGTNLSAEGYTNVEVYINGLLAPTSPEMPKDLIITGARRTTLNN